tara:strand:- start:318 stop:1256 length:939 start_codon:yes stop_codon:yes gene_type:complete
MHTYLLILLTILVLLTVFLVYFNYKRLAKLQVEVNRNKYDVSAVRDHLSGNQKPNHNVESQMAGMMGNVQSMMQQPLDIDDDSSVNSSDDEKDLPLQNFINYGDNQNDNSDDDSDDGDSDDDDSDDDSDDDDVNDDVNDDAGTDDYKDDDLQNIEDVGNETVEESNNNLDDVSPNQEEESNNDLDDLSPNQEEESKNDLDEVQHLSTVLDFSQNGPEIIELDNTDSDEKKFIVKQDEDELDKLEEKMNEVLDESIKNIKLKEKEKKKSKRSVPSDKPSNHELGYTCQSDNDGKTYQVVANKNGVLRWKKISD